MRRHQQGHRVLGLWTAISLALLFTAFCTPVQTEPQAASAGELDGAWRLVSSETIAPDGTRYPGTIHESLLVIGGGYYSMNYAFGRQKSAHYSTPFKPTDTEALARYRSLLINAGRFEIDGARLTIHPEFALVPEYVGGLGEFEYSLSGERLELTWYKIASADGAPDPNTAAGVRYVSRWQRIAG